MNVYLNSIFIFIFCAVFLYLRWLKIKKYWEDRGVPHLPPVPIFGSLTFLQRENMGFWLRRMNKHFKSPYFGIWLFWRPGLVVNSAEIARNILVKDFHIFRNRFLGSGDTDPIGSLNLLTVDDPLWTTMRRHLSGLYTSSKLRIFQDNILMKSKELVQRIRNSHNVKLDLQEVYKDYTTDVIGASAFGIKSDATLTAAGPLRDVANEFSKYSLYRNLAWCAIFFCPELVNTFRFKFFPKSATDYFRKIFRSVQSQRETAPKNKEVRDLLDFLIDIQNGKEHLSEDIIVAQAAIILFGGFDTSANVLAFATYEIAHNAEIQDRIYQELTEAVQNNGNRDLDMTKLSELTYFNCVIKEVLRKYVQMGWIDRIASKDYKVDDNLTIEAGTVVYINSTGMHYDPKYYPDPDKFDPDRFLPENKEKIEKYSYLPFGEGPRGCIGKRFGLMTVQFGLAQILLNYNVQPYPDTPEPSDIKFSNKTVWYIVEDHLHVRFVPRSCDNH